MGAQLNIKSEDAYRLASRLAELTGESLTSVVTKALRAELAREERQRDTRGPAAHVMEIAEEIRPPYAASRPVLEARLAVRRERVAKVIVDSSALAGGHPRTRRTAVASPRPS